MPPDVPSRPEARTRSDAWGCRGLIMCSLGSPGLSDTDDTGKTIIHLAPCQVVMIQIRLTCPQGVYNPLGNNSFTYDKV